MKKFCAPILFVFSIISCQPNSSGSDPYNLGFHAENTVWSRIEGLEILTDSTSGKMYLAGESLFEEVRFSPFGTIYQTIYLPVTENEEIKVTLKARSLNLSSTFLKVMGYDSKENIICTASSRLNDSYAEINMPSHNVRFIKLAIEVSGIMDASIKEQALYLDRMEIKVGGKNIEALSAPNVHAKIDTRKLIPLGQDFSLNLNIEDKNIIGIGETIHGSGTLENCFFELMKHIVMNNNGRLVIMEAPTNLMLKWNLFITDNADFTYDELVADLYQYTLSPELLFEIFQWLKQHNKDRDRKVRILGMDKLQSGFENTFYWADYMYHFMQKDQHPLLDSLSTSLIRNNYEKAKTIAQNSEIKQIMGEEEWNFFMQALPKLSFIPFDLLPLDRSSGDELRERLMSANVQEAIAYGLFESEKAIVWGHLDHIGNHTFFGGRAHSLGYHLHEQYGAQYYKIGLLTGEGAFVAINQSDPNNNSLLTYNDLDSPVLNSLEDVCMKTGHHYFFCPVNAVSETIMSIRFSGKLAKGNQFSYVSLDNRMDAFIFVKESQSFHIPELWLDFDQKRADRFYQTMERNRVPRKANSF